MNLKDVKKALTGQKGKVSSGVELPAVVDKVSFKAGVYTASRTFAFTNGTTEDDIAKAITAGIKAFTSDRELVEIVAKSTKWKQSGGTWVVKFEVVPNMAEVEVLVTIGGPPRKVKIAACHVGTCCDPSTERYWCM